ncbi:MAG: aldehyde dehydrogenase family protein [Lachnospiraceae bacterium]|nr:aldehyde dehydrogenase family protein [Lachnospiraceae bacterium]
MAGWTQEKIDKLIASQRKFFREGKTLDVDFRIRQLKKLKKAVQDHEKEIAGALYADLGRSPTEAYLLDTGPVIAETNEMIRGVKKWSRPEIHYSGMACFPSMVTRVFKMPYGVTLIISPFNFPFVLTLGVLAAAIAGGNTAVIRTSSKSPHSTALIRKILGEIYPEYYVALVEGGHDTAELLLERRFDKIFYTGSPRVGAHVMEKAAQNLTPVALELGGETGNWCIVRKDADIRDAARKIAFFKIANSGQICININQAAVAEEVADSFLKALREEMIRQIGEEPLQNPEYPRLISKEAYDKCAAWADSCRDRIYWGGKGDPGALRFEPTVIYPADPWEAVASQELFAPLLPVVPYRDCEIDALLDLIGKREHGLSLYLFTKDLKWARKVMSSQQYGGGCINEVCLHFMVKGVPFGGVGHSGMGACHGKWGFMEFTHPSTVLTGASFGNLPLREHPYGGGRGDWKLPLLRLFER